MIRTFNTTIETGMKGNLQKSEIIYNLMSYVTYIGESFGLKPYSTIDEEIDVRSGDTEYGLVFDFYFENLSVGLQAVDGVKVIIHLYFKDVELQFVNDVLEWTEKWKWELPDSKARIVG